MWKKVSKLFITSNVITITVNTCHCDTRPPMSSWKVFAVAYITMIVLRRAALCLKQINGHECLSPGFQKFPICRRSPDQLLYFNDTWPFRYRLFHSDRRAHNVLYSPYRADIRTWISFPNTPSIVKIFTTTCCSSFLASIVMSDVYTTRWPHFEGI